MGLASLAAFSYVVLIGGTAIGELSPQLRIINGILAFSVITAVVLRTGSRTDRMDLGVAAALVAFTAAGVLSQFPRQSFDAVFGALVWASGFLLARELLAVAWMRRTFIQVLIGLSVILTFVTLIRWLPVLETWWANSGIALPPFDLDYPGVPWGHWHDLTLLLVILYPAWWVGAPGALRRVAACVMGAITLAIVAIDGSRNVWLAIAIATAVVGGSWVARRRSVIKRAAIPVAVALSVLLLIVVVTGLAASLAARIADVASLESRWAMWGPLTGAWLRDPIAGLGPGSFPWVLQTTDYFSANGLAPRHPDSVLFQLLPEAGLLGMAALGMVVVTVLPAILAGRSTAATWATLVFAAAGLGANPTDFGFLIAVALAWAAYAVPRDATLTRGAASRGRGIVRAASVAAIVVIAIAASATGWAGVAYDRARASIDRGDLADGIRELNLAIQLDPAMALYWRQRGVAQYLQGDSDRAASDLATATRKNPSDDLAWRSLAIAERAAGNHEVAETAVERAASVQRSDATNLLLLAHWHREDGADDAASILAELVQTWPAITGSQGWESVLPSGTAIPGVVDAAFERWRSGAESLEPEIGQGVWLSVLAAQPESLQSALDGMDTTTRLREATASVLQCDDQALGDLAGSTIAERRTLLYWLLRFRAHATNGVADAEAMRIIGIWGGGPLLPEDANATLNPLNENGAPGYGADRWGYRRNPISWPTAPVNLPSPQAGAVHWLIDPVEAVADAGLTERIPLCVQPSEQ